MKDKIRHYLKAILKRIIILAVLIIIAFIFNRIFSFIHQEIIGAIIFISGFSIGVMNYYFNLFKTKYLHQTEYILSIIFVFFLTITMFAVIYSEPIENSNDYFVFHDFLLIFRL